jgi:hypothetical protein
MPYEIKRSRLTPPPAGSWIRLWYGPTITRTGWGSSRWHRFQGDLEWAPRYAAGPALTTACGYRTGTLFDPDDSLKVSLDQPEDACRLCLRTVPV